VTVTSTTEVCDGEWHHVRARRDAGVTVKLYVDKNEEDSDPDTTGDCTSGFALYIGRLTGGTQYFEGDLDEIRLSTVARDSFTD
jgi:hypothetical protein